MRKYSSDIGDEKRADLYREPPSGSTDPSTRNSSFDIPPEDKIEGTKFYSQTHRKLKPRHIQLIAMGGSIGTGLFVTIGTGLIRGGPGSLLIAFSFWTFIMLMITSSVAEFVCYLPVVSPFITMAGRTVDEALECAAGWNFFLMESLYIPFEITAVNGMIHFWRDDYSPAITLCVSIVIYAVLNVFAVRWYGESEFWLSIAKVTLCIGLLLFTLVTMCGGNPNHDAYGFRNFKTHPFNEYMKTGNIGKFHGFLAALIKALFVVVGVEYMSMAAGEAENPRKTMATAYKTVVYRLCLFFIGGSLSVGILISCVDPVLIAKSATSSNSAASPYVIAMQNMGVSVLPDIVNAVVLSSAFSAGNSYTYCSSRALYSLSKRGFAPKVFTRCTNAGVPIYCVGVSICFSLLALLQLGNDAAKVLDYMVNLCTGSQILNYGFMAITYIGFYRACKAQGIERNTLSYTSYFQPYSCIISGIFIWIMIGVMGYSVFMPGNWAVDDFLFSYVMIFVNLAIFIFWKVVKRTKFVRPEEADLTSGLAEIEEHEYEYYSKLQSEGKSTDESIMQKILDWIF